MLFRRVHPGGGPRWESIAVAAGFLTVLLLGVIIRVQTNYGTVKIEIPAGIANIDVKLDGETIFIDGLDHPLRLRPGAHRVGCDREGLRDGLHLVYRPPREQPTAHRDLGSRGDASPRSRSGGDASTTGGEDEDPIADTVPKRRRSCGKEQRKAGPNSPASARYLGYGRLRTGRGPGRQAGSDVFARSDEAVADFVMEADITVTSAESSAAIVFRTSADTSRLYAVTLDHSRGRLWLTKWPPETAPLKDVSVKLTAGTTYQVRVAGTCARITAELDGQPLIDVTDAAYSWGFLGLNVYGLNGPASATFKNVRFYRTPDSIEGQWSSCAARPSGSRIGRLARNCSALLLAAARAELQERTVAQVTLLCQGLRRDPPDARSSSTCQAWTPPVRSPRMPAHRRPARPILWTMIGSRKKSSRIYGPEYRKAQTDQQKKVFAEGILNAARSTTDPKDPATTFVLLEWVSRLAAEAHDVALGGEAIEARAADFQGVDVLAEQWQLCDALSSAIKDPLEQRRLARQLLSFANAAVDEERLELAHKFLDEAKKVAQRAKDKGVTAEVQQTDKLLEMIATRAASWPSLRSSTLEADPLNAAANEKVGRFYCLVMGQWNRGLPWLALGSDQRLQDLAVQELGLLVDPTQLPPPVALRRKLADDWSAVAAAETDRARGMALGRAYHWYREVLRDVTGPDKNIVSKLLRDMRETGDLIVSAPDDAKPYCGHYYKAFPVAMTWHVASRECAELGGHLARVESLSENRFLWKLSELAFVGGDGLWWVDGTDELQEGSWIFSNGEPLTFTNWASGPAGQLGGNRTLFCALCPPSGKWGDIMCTIRRGFICEWDGRLIRILPRGEPPNRKPPRNAVAFGGHHYALIEQPAATWHVAQDLCASQGGHLVRIESPEELEFVKTLVAQSQSPQFWSMVTMRRPRESGSTPKENRSRTFLGRQVYRTTVVTGNMLRHFFGRQT